MDELHSYGALTDAGSHPFYRTVTHVADGENTGHIALEQERISIERPSLRPLTVTDEIRPGQQKTALVALDNTRQPVRSGQSPDEDKHRTGRNALDFSGIGAQHRNLLQVRSAVCLGDAGVCPK